MSRHPRPDVFSLAFILFALSGAAIGEAQPGYEAQCAAGCSAAAPPAKKLSVIRIAGCLVHVAALPVGEPSLELDTLLFHAPQVIPYLGDGGPSSPASEHSQFLRRELARTHAHIRLRVIDAEGVERMNFDARVPIGVKQHLHSEEASGFAPPEVGFTVQRVGLRHLWTRL